MYRAAMKTPFGQHYGKWRKRKCRALADLYREIDDCPFGLEGGVMDEDGVFHVEGYSFWMDSDARDLQAKGTQGTKAKTPDRCAKLSRNANMEPVFSTG